MNMLQFILADGFNIIYIYKPWTMYSTLYNIFILYSHILELYFCNLARYVYTCTFWDPVFRSGQCPCGLIAKCDRLV